MPVPSATSSGLSFRTPSGHLQILLRGVTTGTAELLSKQFQICMGRMWFIQLPHLWENKRTNPRACMHACIHKYANTWPGDALKWSATRCHSICRSLFAIWPYRSRVRGVPLRPGFCLRTRPYSHAWAAAWPKPENHFFPKE